MPCNARTEFIKIVRSTFLAESDLFYLIIVVKIRVPVDGGRYATQECQFVFNWTIYLLNVFGTFGIAHALVSLHTGILI